MEQGPTVIQVESSYFCAGLEVENGTVVSAAPIIHYMLDWSVEKVKAYATKKGWVVREDIC